tara:strand:+ start:977 stop:1759 length:783 start_codon:yes stop_codon:yes gene_type:complete
LSESLLHIEKLCLAYSNNAENVLENVNLSLPKGSIIVLLGENGSGKTTLLKAIAGLQKPKSGKIEIENKKIQSWTKKTLASKVAYVGSKQQFNHLHQLEEFVAFGRYPFLNWLSKLKESDKKLIDTTLQNCDIAHLRNRTLDQLSDGERQKAIIARAFVQQTDLLVLDEPTTHLDFKNAMAILKLLQEQSRQLQMTIIFSTHQLEAAMHIADTVWLCNNKNIHSISTKAFLASKDFQKLVLGDYYSFDQSSNSFKIDFNE